MQVWRLLRSSDDNDDDDENDDENDDDDDDDAGLEADEILGAAYENDGVLPQAPVCDPDGGDSCSSDGDCNEDSEVFCVNDYSNCFFCDSGHCSQGKYVDKLFC